MYDMIKQKRRIGMIFILIYCIGFGLFGAIYIFKQGYMYYHADAIGRQWSEVSPEYQLLILVLMRLVGSGWIATTFATLLMLHRYAKTGLGWILDIILVMNICIVAMTTHTTYVVITRTPATPPLLLSITALLLLCSGYALMRFPKTDPRY